MPATPSIALSNSSCRTSDARLAPSEARSPISGPRPDARASIRFAILAHAMSSTPPTAPSSTNKIVRIVSTDCA